MTRRFTNLSFVITSNRMQTRMNLLERYQLALLVFRIWSMSRLVSNGVHASLLSTFKMHRSALLLPCLRPSTAQSLFFVDYFFLEKHCNPIQNHQRWTTWRVIWIAFFVRSSPQRRLPKVDNKYKNKNRKTSKMSLQTWKNWTPTAKEQLQKWRVLVARTVIRSEEEKEGRQWRTSWGTDESKTWFPHNTQFEMLSVVVAVKKKITGKKRGRTSKRQHFMLL